METQRLLMLFMLLPPKEKLNNFISSSSSLSFMLILFHHKSHLMTFTPPAPICLHLLLEAALNGIRVILNEIKWFFTSFTHSPQLWTLDLKSPTFPSTLDSPAFPCIHPHTCNTTTATSIWVETKIGRQEKAASRAEAVSQTRGKMIAHQGVWSMC